MAATNDTLHFSEMEYLFEALHRTASLIVINVATLAASKDAVVKSTGGSLKAIAKRYGLEITTATKGGSTSAHMANGVAAVTPPEAPTTTASRKRKRKALPVGKMKTKKGKGSVEDESESGVNEKGSENDEEDAGEELA